jgi:hypothetical protein
MPDERTDMPDEGADTRQKDAPQTLPGVLIERGGSWYFIPQSDLESYSADLNLPPELLLGGQVSETVPRLQALEVRGTGPATLSFHDWNFASG